MFLQGFLCPLALHNFQLQVFVGFGQSRGSFRNPYLQFIPCSCGLRHKDRKQNEDKVVANARDHINPARKDKRTDKHNEDSCENARPDSAKPKGDRNRAEGKRHDCERQVKVKKCLCSGKRRAHGDDRQCVSHSNTKCRVSLGYALAIVSVSAAFAAAQAFLYLHLHLAIMSCSFCAIAITFWYGGVPPGILAVVLVVLIRTFVFSGGTDLISRISYDLVFVLFSVFMAQATRARNELEARVAKRTAALTKANEDLQLENVER